MCSTGRKFPFAQLYLCLQVFFVTLLLLLATHVKIIIKRKTSKSIKTSSWVILELLTPLFLPQTTVVCFVFANMEAFKIHGQITLRNKCHVGTRGVFTGVPGWPDTLGKIRNLSPIILVMVSPGTVWRQSFILYAWWPNIPPQQIHQPSAFGLSMTGNAPAVACHTQLPSATTNSTIRPSIPITQSPCYHASSSNPQTQQIERDVPSILQKLTLIDLLFRNISYQGTVLHPGFSIQQ